MAEPADALVNIRWPQGRDGSTLFSGTKSSTIRRKSQQHLIRMHENELKGCGGDSPETFGRDPSSGKWIKEEVPARCGEFLVKVPFEYDQRICPECAVRIGLLW